MTRTVDDVILEHTSWLYTGLQRASDDRLMLDEIARLRADNLTLARAVRVWKPIEEAPHISGDMLVSRADSPPRTAEQMTSIEKGDTAWIIARRLSATNPIAFVYDRPTHFQNLPSLPDPTRDAELAAAVRRAIGDEPDLAPC